MRQTAVKRHFSPNPSPGSCGVHVWAPKLSPGSRTEMLLWPLLPSKLLFSLPPWLQKGELEPSLQACDRGSHGCFCPHTWHILLPFPHPLLHPPDGLLLSPSPELTATWTTIKLTTPPGKFSYLPRFCFILMDRYCACSSLFPILTFLGEMEY